MKSVMKKTTIEGLTSPALAAASMQKAGTSPVFKIDIRRSLRMHSTAAICVGAALFLLVVLFALTRKPLYQAKSLTYIEPLTKSVLSDGTTATFDPSRYDSYLQQQMLTATRPDILQAALAKLPAGTWQEPGETAQSAVSRLQTALKVERVTTSYQLAISLQGTDPVKTAATVNAVTDAYLAQGRHDEHLVTDQRLKLLSEERQRIQTELDQDRSEQATLGQALGVASPVGEGANPYDLQLANVRTELQSARKAHDVAAAQLSSLHNEGGARSPGMVASADELIAADPGLSSMKSTINQRKAVLSTQMAGLTPQNEAYKRGQEEIADLDKSMDVMSADLRNKAERRLEDKLGLELRRTADIENRLNGQLAQQTASATSAAPRLQRANELSADLVRLTTRYATVDDAMRGMELESNGPGLAHLSVAAAIPTVPEASKARLLFLAAFPVALFAGILTAVLLQKRDPRVYTSRDVEEVLGFMPIGILPARAEVSDAVVEEYLLRLAAGLESAYRVSDARSYVFSAASPVTDVSGFVEALSRKLRQLGLRVLIVDASRLLQPILTGESAGEVLRPGAAHEGFATANLERLKSDHDLLLIDAPALLHSAETEYAVRCSDATIVVAECGVTVRAELAQAAALLQRLNVAGVGAVLDEVKLSYADARFRNAVTVLESRHEASAGNPKATQDRQDEIKPIVREKTRQVVEPVVQIETASSVSATPALAPTPTVRKSVTPQAEMNLAATTVAAVMAEPELVQTDVSAALPAAEADLDANELGPEEKPSWLQRVFARGQSEQVVSILPDESEEDAEEATALQPIVAAQEATPVKAEPIFDIPAIEVATAVPLVVPVALPFVPPMPVSGKEQLGEVLSVPEMPVAVVPAELLERTSVASKPAKHAAQEMVEPAFIQSFEEPVFTRDDAALEQSADAEQIVIEEPKRKELVHAEAPVYAKAPVVLPSETLPVLMPAAAATVIPAAAVKQMPIPQVEWPMTAAPVTQREQPARRPDLRSDVRSEMRSAYVPAVTPGQSRVSEPLTTGRWEPVRSPRSESGLHEASAVPAVERGVSRISGGRRAAMSELRDLEPKMVRPLPTNGWVPPVPAARNVNPLGDDGMQVRPGSLTRRWEMLSRFDQGNPAPRAKVEDPEAALAVPGPRAEYRSGR